MLYCTLLGTAYSLSEDPKRAIPYLERAIDISPNEASLFLKLAKVYADTYRWDQVVSILRSLTRLDSSKGMFRWSLAVALFSRGSFAEADSEFEFLQKSLSPVVSTNEFAAVLAIRGRCKISLGAFDEAEQFLLEARGLTPWNLDLCRGMIDLHHFTDRFDKVYTLIGDYVTDYPDLYPLHIWMANHLHYYLYDPAEAVDWYIEGLNRMRDSEVRRHCEQFVAAMGMLNPTLDQLVEAMIQIGDLRNPLSHIRSYQARGVFNQSTYLLHLATYYHFAKNYRHAEKLSQTATRLRNAAPDAWASLALAQAEQGKIVESRGSLAKALEIDPGSTVVLDALGTIHAKEQLWQEASAAYEKIVKFAPLSVAWWENLAACYVNLGEVTKARFLYEKALSADPNNAKAWRELEVVYSNLGEEESAQKARDKRLRLESKYRA